MHATETLQSDPTGAFLGCEPSAVIKGVNVIKGTFCTSEVDMVIPGALPIVIKRSYMGIKNDKPFILLS